MQGQVIRLGEATYNRLAEMKRGRSFDALLRQLIGLPPGRKQGWPKGKPRKKK